MNKNKMKIAGLVIGSLLTTTTFAQNTGVNITSTTMNSGVTASLAGTNVLAPNSGNSYEKELTPLLRTISKKKTQLEDKKLDLEIEKINVAKIKLEQEKLNPSVNSDQSKMINVSDLSNPPLVQAPVVTPTKVKTKKKKEAEVEDDIIPMDYDVRVLMVYGYDDNLFAKITSGSQGGYVIKKGDVLPDGRLVTNISANYVEVKIPSSNKNKGYQKIYVTGPAPTGANGQPLPIATAPSQSVPLMGPMSTPGMTTTSGNVQMPTNLRFNLPGLK